MNAEQVLKDFIGALVLERATLIGEINRLRALLPAEKVESPNVSS
jgi:hypothetical protein